MRSWSRPALRSRPGTTRPRVLVVGLGDTGLLSAIRLADGCDVVGVTSTAEFLSGQELGTRIAWPERWQRDNRYAFDRFRRLDGVRVVQGVATAADLDRREVTLRLADGSASTEPYDVLVVATGVSNGFWRRPDLRSSVEITRDLDAVHATLAAADSVAVVGGGAAAVGAAAQLAHRWPGRRTDLYFPGERALVDHHAKVWTDAGARLEALGVRLHPGHRAHLPPGADAITHDPVTFVTGQAPVAADAVVWAVGRVRPNTGWLPDAVLDAEGFVRVEPTLQLPGHPDVFAVGDLAATDPLRCSARNRVDRLLADNVRARQEGRPLAAFRPARRRWGSVLGIQPEGIVLYTPTGGVIRFPSWSVDRILLPFYLRRLTYGGVRARPRRSAERT